MLEVAKVVPLKVKQKLSYDLWGETVNLASRMESAGVPGRIQVTAPLYKRLRRRYRFQARGVVIVKGVGPVSTYLLLSRRRRRHCLRRRRLSVKRYPLK